EVGPGRQVSHDVSLITRWSASGPEENVTFNGLLRADGGGLCPVRGPGGALQRLMLIVSARADLSATADGGRVAAFFPHRQHLAGGHPGESVTAQEHRRVNRRAL
ncbi:MAG: hypothetical protein WBF34_17305, partial [Streptosporangiaceae bacterium]